MKESHYCKTCKGQVPLAPGTGADPHFTVGIAHVSRLNFFGNQLPCEDAVRRTYKPDEQVRNLEDLLGGPLINDGTFLIGPGLGHPGPNPGPPREPVRRCLVCDGRGTHIRNSGTPDSMEEDCPGCLGSGHL